MTVPPWLALLHIVCLTALLIWVRLRQKRQAARRGVPWLELRGTVVGAEPAGSVVHCAQIDGSSLFSQPFKVATERRSHSSTARHQVIPDGSLLLTPLLRHPRWGRLRCLAVGDRVTVRGVETSLPRGEHLYRQSGRQPALSAIRISPARGGRRAALAVGLLLMSILGTVGWTATESTALQRLLEGEALLGAGQPIEPRFVLVDLVNFKRAQVRNLAFSSNRQELFVSFSDQPAGRTRFDALYQWSLEPPQLLHTYPMPPGYVIDEVSLSPEGTRLVLCLYSSDALEDGHWSKYLLIDTREHRVIRPDLGVYDNRRRAEFARTPHFRIADIEDNAAMVFDFSGRRVDPGAAVFQPVPRRPAWVVYRSKEYSGPDGLFFADEDGDVYHVSMNQWHSNFGLTRDQRYLAFTTWDGELAVWSAASHDLVYHRKIASNYGYLVTDEKHERFLIGDASHDGTTWLRALQMIRR